MISLGICAPSDPVYAKLYRDFAKRRRGWRGCLALMVKRPLNRLPYSLSLSARFVEPIAIKRLSSLRSAPHACGKPIWAHTLVKAAGPVMRDRRQERHRLPERFERSAMGVESRRALGPYPGSLPRRREKPRRFALVKAGHRISRDHLSISSHAEPRIIPCEQPVGACLDDLALLVAVALRLYPPVVGSRPAQRSMRPSSTASTTPSISRCSRRCPACARLRATGSSTRPFPGCSNT